MTYLPKILLLEYVFHFSNIKITSKIINFHRLLSLFRNCFSKNTSIHI